MHFHDGNSYSAIVIARLEHVWNSLRGMLVTRYGDNYFIDHSRQAIIASDRYHWVVLPMSSTQLSFERSLVNECCL